MEFLAVTLTLR